MTKIASLFSSPASLAKRIVTKMLVFSIILSVGISFVLSVINYYYNLQQTKQQINVIKQSYLPSLAKGLWEVDHERVNLLLEGLLQNANIQEVLITSVVGQQYQSKNTTPHTIFDQYQLNIIYSVLDQEHLVGTINIKLTNHYIKQNAIKQAVYISAASILAIMLSASLLLFLFKEMVSKHLKTLALFAKNLDPNNIRAPLVLAKASQDDELDAVVHAFNLLQNKVQLELAQRTEYELALKQHKASLEEKVRLRTRELEQTNDELEAKTQLLLLQNQDLDAYARTVAHDLKNPLTSIICFSTLLNDAKSHLSATRQQETLHKIHTTAVKMNEIIDALLLLASIRHGNTVKIHELDMAVIVNNVLARLETFADKHNAKIYLSTDWPVTLGYAQWIEEVWANYLSNAIKYGGPNPEIQLGATLLDNTVEYWVSDNGRALSDVEQLQLFNTMQRYEPEKAEGHGFGLSIVKRIIEQLGGDVGYRASQTGGSIFWFSLPKA